MRINLLFFATMLFLLLQIQEAKSQDKKVTHTFKITGRTKVPVRPYSMENRAVEYNPNSHDHLFVSEFNEDGKLFTKTEFLFKGEKFNLADLDKYIESKELYRDGVHINYGEGKSVSSELIYKVGKVLQATTYYSNGNKEMFISGDAEILNGEYKMWHSNGQLSFFGNYKNNLKDGEFESFDPSGNIRRKGIYEKGKLISGESVVQDFEYTEPEALAQFIGGDTALDDYMKLKTADLEAIKNIAEGVVRIFNLKLTINNTGQIKNLQLISQAITSDQDIINALFKSFPDFKPALIEDVPVSSILNLNLILTNKGLQTRLKRVDSPSLERKDSLSTPYVLVDEMPEFPGGEMAFRRFLASTVKYPKEAMERNIQGKVFISYVIEEDGSVSDILVKRSVHPLLDAEAVKVVQLMPKWIPGRQKGKPVRIIFTVPIDFVLQ